MHPCPTLSNGWTKFTRRSHQASPIRWSSAWPDLQPQHSGWPPGRFDAPGMPSPPIQLLRPPPAGARQPFVIHAPYSAEDRLRRTVPETGCQGSRRSRAALAGHVPTASSGSAEAAPVPPQARTGSADRPPARFCRGGSRADDPGYSLLSLRLRPGVRPPRQGRAPKPAEPRFRTGARPGRSQSHHPWRRQRSPGLSAPWRLSSAHSCLASGAGCPVLADAMRMRRIERQIGSMLHVQPTGRRALVPVGAAFPYMHMNPIY